MPNRKTFDEADKYDHSSRPLEDREKHDLQPYISDEPDRHAGASVNGNTHTPTHTPTHTTRKNPAPRKNH
jgi:hypothetical protein